MINVKYIEVNQFTFRQNHKECLLNIETRINWLFVGFKFGLCPNKCEAHIKTVQLMASNCKIIFLQEVVQLFKNSIFKQ